MIGYETSAKHQVLQRERDTARQRDTISSVYKLQLKTTEHFSAASTLYVGRGSETQFQVCTNRRLGAKGSYLPL